MFVLSSDFDVPPFNLPNLDDNNSFADYVEAAEAEILKKLLGKTIYDQFVAGLTAAGSAWSSTTTYALNAVVYVGNNVYTSVQAANTNHAVTDAAWWTLTTEDDKWLLLKNGDDYVWSDVDYEWVGMVKLLKPYIFAMWLKDTYDSLSGIGVSVPEAENGSVISPARRIAAAYNKFSELSGAQYCTENTLYGYLVANEVTYPDAATDFTPVGFMNAWNI